VGPGARMRDPSAMRSRIWVEQLPLGGAVHGEHCVGGDSLVAVARLSEGALDVVAESVAPFVGFGLAEIPPSRVTCMLKEGRFPHEAVYWC
jgi:hypothetical protein